MAKLTSTVIASSSSWTNFLAWAGASSGISSAMTTLGFSAVTDTYSANGGSSSWANGTTNNGLTDPNTFPIAGGALFGATFPTTTNNARAAAAASTFQGGWAIGTAYTVGQVVTYTPSSGGQQTFICWATGGIGIAPCGVATSQTFWAPYWFEIWKMSSSGLTDVYIKFEYGCATLNDPQMSVQFGTAANGAGSISASGIFSTVEQCMLGTANSTSTECDFASDGANWFGMYMWRGNTTTSSFLCFERSISGQTGGAPVYSTTNQYITYVVGFTTPTWHQCSLFLSSHSNTSSIRNAYVSTVNLHVAGSQLVNNITPALPVFGLVGWTGNPMTVMQTYSVTDTTEGATVSSTVYGTSTNYLTSINSFLGALGGVASIYATGIKWQ